MGEGGPHVGDCRRHVVGNAGPALIEAVGEEPPCAVGDVAREDGLHLQGIGMLRKRSVRGCDPTRELLRGTVLLCRGPVMAPGNAQVLSRQDDARECLNGVDYGLGRLALGSGSEGLALPASCPPKTLTAQASAPHVNVQCQTLLHVHDARDDSDHGMFIP